MSAAVITLWGGIAEADTTSAMGNRGGEGTTPFTGLAQSPEANLFTGALGTGISIEVPPGRKNVTPQLTLQYSSSGGPGPFGYGWDLPLGRIERSTKWGTPRCTGPHTDEFILTLPSGTVELRNDPQGSNYYRPVVEEGYLRAEKFVQDNYWEVRDRAGFLYVFGKYDTRIARLHTGNDLFLSEQGGVCSLTTAWALLHVRDPNGNSMDLSYVTLNNVSYPLEIRYGGNVNTGLSHWYSVSFSFAGRPDFIISYHGGVRSQLSLLAQSITVTTFVPTTQVVRTYSLTYDQGGAVDGYRSMLTSVQAAPLPAQVLSYADSLDGFVSSSYTPPNLSPYRLRRRDELSEVLQTLLDMNGDGFVDVVRHVAAGQPWRVYPGGPRGPATSYFNWNTPAAVGSPNQIRNVWVNIDPCDEDGWSCTAQDTFDISGDGIPDYVKAEDGTVYAGSPSGPCGNYSHYRWQVFKGRAFDQAGAGGKFDDTATLWCSPSRFVMKSKNDETFQDVADMNADGLPDLVTTQSLEWQVYLNTGSGFELEPIIYDAPVPSLSETYGGDDFTLHMPVDFNGDGLTDLVWSPKPSGSPPPYDPNCEGSASNPVRCLYVSLNTGHGLAPPYVVDVPGWDAPGVVALGVQRFAGDPNDRRTVRDLIDVNGDGLPDWVRVDPSTQQWRVILNTGGMFEPLNGTTEPRVWAGITGPIRLQDGRDTRVDVFDFNGDGLLDRGTFVNDSSWTIHTNNSKTRPNLLIGMENGIFGRTFLRYGASTTCKDSGGNLIPCDHTGGDGKPDLPYASWVVTAIAETDGLCDPTPGSEFQASNTCVTTGHQRLATFTYKDGRFDAGAREFRGFRDVFRTSVDGNATRTIFAQSNEAKGRVLETYTYAGTTSLVRHEYNTWSTRTAGPRTQIWLGGSVRFLHDGQQPGTFPHVFITVNDPPDTYGNILKTKTGGAFDPQPVETLSEFTLPQGGSQVYDKPKRTYVQRNGQLLSELWFYYDGYTANADYGKVGLGNVTRTVARLGSDPAAYPETWMSYDAYGNMETVTDPLGRITRTDYDDYFLYPLDQYNALNHKTTTVMSYKWGKPEQVTDANGGVTTFTYDTAGRLECLKLPLSTAPCSTRYRYELADSSNELSVVHVDREEPNAAPAFYVTSSEYFDALGRHRETHAFRVVNGVDQVVVEDKVAYDSGGRVTKRHEPYVLSSPPSPERVTQYDYRLNGGGLIDPLGRVYQTTGTDGTVRRTLYRGQEQWFTDEAGVETRRLTSPHRSLLKEETRRPGDSSPYMKSEHTYDGLGRVLTSTQNGNPATTISNTYDLLGRKTQMADPDSDTWNYEYDKVGNVIRRNDPKANQQLQFCYDKLDRIVLECPLGNDSGIQVGCGDNPPGCPEPTKEIRYFYDDPAIFNSKGLLARVNDPSGSTIFEGYDVRGRLRAVTKEIDAGGITTSGTTEYEYDEADRIKRTRYPDGELVEAVYDRSGQPIMLQSNTAYISSVTYDFLGRATMIAHANGVNDTRSYHQSLGSIAHQRLATLRTSKGASEYLDLSYQSYTQRGAIQQVVDNRNGTGVLSNKGTYTYDEIGRLTDIISNPEINGAYRYDALGNMTRKESRFFDYSATKPHQPSNIRIGSETAQPTPVPHDANGNRMDTTGGAQDYTYDAWDRLTEIRVPNGPTVNFVYDYAGKRVAKKVNGVVVERYYSDLTETTDDGNQYKSYYLGGTRVASQRTTFVGWELASAPSPAVQFVMNDVGRPAMILILRRDIQLTVALCGPLLGVALWFAPWRRKRVVGIAVRHGRVVVVLIAFSWSTLPLPILVQPTQGQICPMPTATPTPPPGGEVRHYHADHLGSTQAVTDSAGNLIEQIRYRAYGEIRGRWDGSGIAIVNPSPDYRYEFTTYETEMSSGLQYAGARFYDPALGMFLTHDPASEFASPYAYGPWDPMNGSDPTGMFWQTILLGVLGSIATVIDTYRQTGSIWQGFKAQHVQLGLGAVIAPGTSAGLQLVAPDAFGKTDAYGIVSGLASTDMFGIGSVSSSVFGIARNFEYGNYASASVGVISLAFSAYNGVQTYQQFAQAGAGHGLVGSQEAIEHIGSGPAAHEARMTVGLATVVRIVVAVGKIGLRLARFVATGIGASAILAYNQIALRFGLPLRAPPTFDVRFGNVVGNLFKSTDTVAGGTAGAIRYTARTGELVKGRDHILAGTQRVQALNNVLARGLNSFDGANARALRQDLINALHEAGASVP